MTTKHTHCTCRRVPGPAGGNGTVWEYCPMHAAAPELLSALESALADNGTGTGEAWRTAARAAVAKARGEA